MSNVSVMPVCAGPGKDHAATEDLSGGRARTSVETASSSEAAAGAAAAADHTRPEGTRLAVSCVVNRSSLFMFKELPRM